MGCIGYIDEVVGIRVEIAAQRLTRFLDQAVELASQKEDRLPLQTSLPVLIGIEDRPGRSTVRAVIEEDNILIEKKLFPDGWHAAIIRERSMKCRSVQPGITIEHT